MLDPGVSATFENVDKGHQVGVHIGVGVFQGVTNTRLGSEVDHAVKPVFGKQLSHGRAVGDVHVQVGESLPFG